MELHWHFYFIEFFQKKKRINISRISEGKGSDRYLYVLNNPLRYMDPYGFSPFDRALKRLEGIKDFISFVNLIDRLAGLIPGVDAPIAVGGTPGMPLEVGAKAAEGLIEGLKKHGQDGFLRASHSRHLDDHDINEILDKVEERGGR